MPNPLENALPAALADLHSARQALAAGEASLSDILAQTLQIAESTACAHAYIKSPVEAHLKAAPAKAGNEPLSPLAGLPVSIKDLFAVAGEQTQAGSIVLADRAAATQDCPAVSRLREAGALIAGRTNMVEFAFSGIGINPHHGTPANPADPLTARIPGGSSSGAAVSVASGAAFAGLGSDTGGSIRIPAALCGVVGFKSTARLVPTAGALPLSTTLDTVCAMTRSVRDAITIHEILAARKVQNLQKPLAQCRFAVATTLLQDGMEDTVAKAFDHSLTVLRKAGASIREIALSEIGELGAINATGGFSAAESYAWHRMLLEKRQADYDPRVAVRILRGANMSAAVYIDLLQARASWIARMSGQLEEFDAVLSPTVPLVAPAISPLIESDEEFFRVNALMLRNPSMVNMLDGCAISLPCQLPGQLPVGLMLWHSAMQDDKVLNAALAVETALKT